MWVFHALRGYSSLLEGYAVGRVFNLDLGYVLKLRNLLHYHVLSLPAATFADTGTVSHIYESLRLTLIVYSMLVLFPVPLMTSPYPTLAGLLRYELESIRDEEWTAMSSLLLWILTLGGIAALDTPHRVWFSERLHLQLGDMGIISWEGFIHIMNSLLWLDSPCGVEGRILWKEAQECGHQLLAEHFPT
jgi:hypothetical protein